MSETYRPALVPAGHAIMHGKLVFSHSRSTFLSRKRVSIEAYFDSEKSTVTSPPTVTGFDCGVFIPSCHATTL